jgi:hypothetical protein
MSTAERRLTVLLALAALSLLTAARPAEAFSRTEERAPCTETNPLRNPYFGDTHVHTSLSFDANVQGVQSTPRDAYRFARGAPLGIPPYDRSGEALRTVRLERPLDFAVVTDHAELFGETRICQAPMLAGYGSLICRVYRRWPFLTYYIVNGGMLNVRDPKRYRFCGANAENCLSAARGPWREIREAAEEAYDRSSACAFTTFVGYEWSGNPDSNMIHRNVIFRNERVPEQPVSYIDETRPERLWERLRSDCIERGDGCDVLTIPHNSNLSGGWLFQTENADGSPLTREDALRRAAMEPLVEVLQHKGESECLPGGATEDELCAFEKLPYARMDEKPFRFRWTEPPPMAFTRDVLAAGLVEQARIGANPFKFGLIASTDTHLGTPGLAGERDYVGHAAGGGEALRVRVPLLPDGAIEFNPGGLAVLWAEENSRDALFEAMRRREAYATSGPRILVRFFGGWEYAGDLCGEPDFVAHGYGGGVPMGGDLPAPSASASAPRFAVWALADPGTEKSPGTPLQRVQIVKLWVEDGQARERVYDIAGDADENAGVDLRTCETRGDGAESLCTVWQDPDFDRATPALYYARVVENPSCRWSTWVCNAHGVDCQKPASVPSDLKPCCDPAYPKTIQERAWTSPIWYTPAAGG